MKPKNFEIIFDDDQCLLLLSEEQMIFQNKEIDKDYVIC
jgi:hypothetical protein